jgi:transposase
MGKLREEVKDLKKQLKEKDRLIAGLEARLEDKESQRKELLSYLYKPGKKDGTKAPRGKKPGARAFHRPRPRPEDVTERRTYSLVQCPICRHSVGLAAEETVKYEEDIVLVPRNTVKEFTIARHWCGHCETFVRSSDIPPISRIGPNTTAYILYARYRLRLPFKKIKESLSDLHNFRISEGEIAEKLKEAEALFGQDYEAITALIREAKVVYADETGWRMEGENWWLWCFTTPEGTKYLLEDTRGRGVPQSALGEKKDRILVSDGYAAYKNLEGMKQQCWVHLLRSAKLHSPMLYGDLALLYHKLLLELEKPISERNKTYFGKELARLAAKKYPEPTSRKPRDRIRRDAGDLLTCLSHDGVLPENNTAERAIRPQVVMRKIFGGSRSPAGARAHAVNTSVLRTLEQQNPDKGFFDVLLPLIEKRRSGL